MFFRISLPELQIPSPRPVLLVASRECGIPPLPANFLYTYPVFQSKGKKKTTLNPLTFASYLRVYLYILILYLDIFWNDWKWAQ